MTTMQFRSAKKRRAQPTTFLFWVGGALLFVAILFHSFIGATIAGLLSFFTVTESDAYRAVPHAVLRERLVDAEQELSHIRYQAVLYGFLAQEHAEYKTMMGIASHEVVARGRVFSRPPRTHYDTLLVAMPADASVVVGDYAFAYDVLVGEVVAREGGVARVQLFSSPGIETNVRLGEPSALLIARGLGGGAFIFETPKKITLAVGDPVRGAENGEVLAVVQTIIDEPERATKTVYAASPVAVADMVVVELVRSFATLPLLAE
jgi:cell shape-determining protein MreC